MSEPALDNATELVVHPQPLLDKDGERLVVIVKATLELSPDGVLELAPKERRRGIRMADLPWGDPEKSSVIYPADLCLRKPGTDVVVVAKGFAPGGKPVPSFDVAVQVGRLRKVLRVFAAARVAGGRGRALSATTARRDRAAKAPPAGEQRPDLAAAPPPITVAYVLRASVKAPRRLKDARIAVRELEIEADTTGEAR